MAETLERLEVEIDADISDLRSNLNRARSQFDGFSNEIQGSTSGITSALGKVGKAAVGAFAIKEIVEFGKECIDLASDLQEVQNVVDVTFGSMSGQIDTFAANARDRFGLAEKTVKQFSGTMGAMLKSSGLTTDIAYEMSTQLTALSGDLASFYNLSADEAFTKIRAGISGETEPLKQLGINMSVANMEAYALSEGITKTYDSMTQAEQAILRYNYLIATTSAQQGDFARTSESWANQTKTLTMRFDELKGSIGTGLMSILTPLLEVVNKVIEGIRWISDGINDLLGISTDDIDTSVNITATDSDVSDVSADLGTAATNAKGVADGIDKASKAASKLKRTVSGFDEANVLSDNAASGLLSKGALKDIEDMATAIKSAYDGLEDVNEEASILDKAFGNVHLNASQIDSTVSHLVSQGDLKKVAELSQSINNMKGFAENINTAKETIEGYHWMVNMGIQLTEEDEAGYKQAVNDYVANVQKYVTESKKAVNIAATLIFGEGSKEQIELNTFYTGIEGQLGSLSKQIKEKVNSSWEDGVLSIDEAKEIQNLMDQEQRIVNALNEAEFEVKFEHLKIKASGADLDLESFRQIASQSSKQLAEELKGLEEGSMLIEKSIRAEYKLSNQTDADKKKMEEALDGNWQALQRKIISSTAKYVEFTITTGLQFVNPEYDKENLKKTVQTALDELFSQENIEYLDTNMPEIYWTNNLEKAKTALKKGFAASGLSDTAKAGIKEVLDSLKPQEEEWNKVADEYQKKGKKIPENVSAGLTSINVLKAMTDDADGMWWLLGNQLKNSPEYEKIKGELEKKGQKLPPAMEKGYNSPQSKLDMSKGWGKYMENLSSTILKNDTANETAKKSGEKLSNRYYAGVSTKNKNDAAAFAEARGKATAEAYANKKNLEAANKSGQEINKKYAKGIKTNTAAEEAERQGKEAAKAMAKGATTINSKANQTKLNTATNAYWGLAGKQAVNVLDIKGGKSGLFGKYADYTVQGYNDSITKEKNINATLTAVGKWAKVITTVFPFLLNMHSPSKLFEQYGTYTVEGFNNGITDNITNSKKAMQIWGSDIAKWGNNYLANDFGSVASASIKGNMTADITGSLVNAVKTAMDAQNNTFVAEVNIGGEKHVVQFVKQYNKMHDSNPDFGFSV